MKKIVIFCFLIFQLASCQNRKVKITPKEFTSIVKAPKGLYQTDSIKLVKLIRNEIKDKKEAYSANFYDDSTGIIIDTIMYNNNFDRMVFFIIDKVENKKLYPKDWKNKDVKPLEQYGNLPYEGYHYNAKAYLGVRNGDAISINNYFRLNIDDYTDIKELKQRQRQMLFEEYSAVNEKGYEYNLNDKRFWNNSHIWDEIDWGK